MDQEALNIFIRAFQQQLTALKQSARWRIGHRLIRCIEFFLGRRPKSLAIDHLETMTNTLLDALQEENHLPKIPAEIPSMYNMAQLKASTVNIQSCALVISNKQLDKAVQGDVFTALELAKSLESNLGWNCFFVDPHSTNKIQADIIISLLFEFDIRPIKSDARKLAWIRSYAEYWIMKPWFDEFDIVLCSSKKIQRFIQSVTDRPAYLYPIATNISRFQNGEYQDEMASDYCFTGNYWNKNRQVAQWLDPTNLHWTFKVYGDKWNEHPKFSPYHAGHIAYKDIPNAYASTQLVLDDANASTFKWESINSRVFDVLGMGKMILSNNRKGMQNLFENPIPTYESATELNEQIERYLAQPEDFNKAIEKLQSEIQEMHTYDIRAHQLNAILELSDGAKLNIAIKISVAEANDLMQWGDFHFARSLKTSLEKWGHHVRIDILPLWYDKVDDDVTIVLRGLRAYQPKGRGIHLMWLISHPNELDEVELNAYDHVFVASEYFTQKLKTRVQCPVSTLLQATEFKKPEIRAEHAIPSHEVLYIANARNTKRHAVALAEEANVSLQIYGREWHGLVDDSWQLGAYIANEQLPAYYEKARVVLVDHWEDMRSNGFISNRVFDVLASGGRVLCDQVEGVDTLHPHAISTYSNAKELKDALMNPSTDRMTEAERNAFIRAHNFDRRVISILNVIYPLIRKS